MDIPSSIAESTRYRDSKGKDIQFVESPIDEVMSSVRSGLTHYLDTTCEGEDELCNRINKINNQVDEVETHLSELKSKRASLESQLQVTRIIISELRGTLAASGDNYAKLMDSKERELRGEDTYSDETVPGPSNLEYTGVASKYSMGDATATPGRTYDPRHPMGYGL